MRKLAYVALAALALLLAQPFSGYAAQSRGGGGGGGFRSGGGGFSHAGGFSRGGGGFSGGARSERFIGGGVRGGSFRGGGFGGEVRGGGFRDGRFHHHHDHFRGDFFVGVGPFWDPWWWGPPYPYPYYGSTVVVDQTPQEYIVQDSQPAAEEYWYFCRHPEGYYPYVKKCPDGWLKVVPAPPPADEE